MSKYMTGSLLLLLQSPLGCLHLIAEFLKSLAAACRGVFECLQLQKLNTNI